MALPIAVTQSDALELNPWVTSVTPANRRRGSSAWNNTSSQLLLAEQFTGAAPAGREGDAERAARRCGASPAGLLDQANDVRAGGEGFEFPITAGIAQNVRLAAVEDAVVVFV